MPSKKKTEKKKTEKKKDKKSLFVVYMRHLQHNVVGAAKNMASAARHMAIAISHVVHAVLPSVGFKDGCQASPDITSKKFTMNIK